MRLPIGATFIKGVILAVFLLVITNIASSGREVVLIGHNRVAYSGSIVATAYNSEVGQTDDTPWTTACGTRCREGVIASNFLPIGTKVVIEGFGNRVFTVEDRMNKRFARRIDIWFRYHDQAMKFGKRKIRYHVLEAA
jgi:3D (Asp-Asp-Asp) domain-containing protein